MNLTPLGWAILAVIRADADQVGPLVMETYCNNLEQRLRDLIRKEMVIQNVLKECDPLD